MNGRQLFALAMIGFGGIVPAQLLAQVPENKSLSREEPIGSLRAPDLQAVHNQATAWFQDPPHFPEREPVVAGRQVLHH